MENLDVSELERIGKEKDDNYYTNEDHLAEFVVHDKHIGRIIHYLLRFPDKEFHKKGLINRTGISEEELGSSSTGLELNDRWAFLKEKLLEETGEHEKYGTPTYSLDSESKYIDIYKEDRLYRD